MNRFLIPAFLLVFLNMAMAQAAVQLDTILPVGVGITSGESSGGIFSVVSQSPAFAMSGGRYGVVGGIESVAVAVQTPGAPLLNIARTENLIVLSWATVGSFALEVTDALQQPISWSSVAAAPTQSGNQYTAKVAMTVGKKFFRLRKQ
jgi:hypothetical protein